MSARFSRERFHLERFLFDPSKARQPVGSLSGGERARVALAKMLTQSVNAIILDEPTNDLDVMTLAALEEMLVELTWLGARPRGVTARGRLEDAAPAEPGARIVSSTYGASRRHMASRAALLSARPAHRPSRSQGPGRWARCTAWSAVSEVDERATPPQGGCHFRGVLSPHAVAAGPG
ncbi:ATP-binding cassette domain-containing protein [Sorangium sp. So ce1335]